MRSTSLSLTIALTLLLSIAPAAAQQEQAEKKPQTAMPAAPKPGPEMEKIKFLVGTWSYSHEFEKTPFSPNGGKGSGSYTARLGPGGFSILADLQGTSDVEGEISAHQVLTWDAAARAYKTITVGNDFPGCLISTGQWDGANLVFNGEFDAGGTKFLLRYVYKDIAPGSLTILEYSSTGGGPMQLLLTTKATKK